MARLYTRRSKQAGLSPGTLLPSDERKTEKIRITLIDYDRDRYEEKELISIEDVFPYKDTTSVSWINIDGLHRVDILEKIGSHFKIHPLVLEDIHNTTQRPKMETFDDHVFIVTKMFEYDESDGTIGGEQLSIILGSNFVISFQEKEGDVFNIIRQRIRNNESRIRKNGSDYLVYRLLDTVVDHYFVILEKLGERIENLEEVVLEKPTTDTLQEIHSLKREMIILRKSVWPLREVVSGLQREESSLMKESTGIFFRDVYDHTIQVIDTIESFRDMVSGMLDIYLSIVSNKMNEVMKVLTIMASIFIPLTFIAGIYGMNFNTETSRWNMPELGWALGYPMVLALMAVVAILMILYFKSKKWI